MVQASGRSIFSAIERLITPVMPERLGLGLAVSVVASAVNGAVARVLHRKGRREKSATLVADAKHLATDVVTSAAVLVGVGLVAEMAIGGGDEDLRAWPAPAPTAAWCSSRTRCFRG